MSTPNLSVSPSQAIVMLEFFTTQRKEHVNAHKEVFNKLHDIDTMIDKLKTIMNASGPKYPKDGSWNDRIKYVLGSDPYPLTTREIVDAIAQIEGIPEGTDRWKDIYKGVAPSLSTGDKWYSKRENKDGNNVYSLKE